MHGADQYFKLVRDASGRLATGRISPVADASSLTVLTFLCRKVPSWAAMWNILTDYHALALRLLGLLHQL